MTALNARRWEQIEDLFHGALEQPADLRTRFLERRTQDDPELLEQVQRLLKSFDRGGQTLERGIALSQPGTATVDAADELPLTTGELVGSYRVLRPIGRGGMGDVYLAERADGQFEQRVALKVMRNRTEAHLDRFHAERRILARLEHPGIARLIDGGLLADGRPYMAMEYVAGQPIARYCHHQRLNLEQRLALFEQVCAAVEFAHSNLVVHRDLKSGNILVTDDGHIKLLDFGVAKLLSEHWTGDDETTRGTPLTPDHAAPEQLTGGAITTATDVYALGVVLHVLLAGQSPWSHLREQPVSLALRTILSEEPPGLSTAAEQNPQAPVAPRLLQGDLTAIVARALRKSPADRYRTVESLCDDLQRYRDGAPVQARSGNRAYRLGRFIRRYRWPLLAACSLLVLMTGFTLRLAVETRRAQAAEAQALAEAHTAEAVSDYLVSLFESASPRRTGGKSIEPKQLVDDGLKRLDRHLQERPTVRARMLATLSRLYSDMGYEADALAAADSAVAAIPDPTADPVAYGLALSRRAAAEGKAGHHDRAIESARNASQWLSQRLPEGDPKRLRTIEVQALALLNSDQLNAAIELVESVLAQPGVRRQSQEYAALLSALAAAYTLNGDGERAIPMQHHVMRIYANELGAADPLTVDALSVLAHIEYYAGRYQASVEHMREALAQASRYFAPGTADLLNMQRGLANGLGELGRVREAIEIERQIVEDHRQISGDNPGLGISYTNLAADLNHYGDYEGAAQNALAAQQLLDPASEPVERVRANLMLARAMLRLGHVELALTEMQPDVPEGFSGVLGDGYRGLRQMLLADAELARGRVDQAGHHLAEARVILERSQPAQARILILLDYQAARLRRAQGDLIGAEAQLAEVLARMLAVRGPDAPDSLEIEVEYLDLISLLGRAEEAAARLSQLAPRLEDRLAPTARARRQADTLAKALQAANDARMSGLAAEIR